MSKESETYRAVVAALQGHQHAEELTQVLKTWDSAGEFHETSGGDQVNVSLAEAVYHISYQWHGGQSCELYAAGCVTGYEPGISGGMDCGSEAEMIFRELEVVLLDGRLIENVEKGECDE